MKFKEALNLILFDPAGFKRAVIDDPALLEIKWAASETLLHFMITERYHDRVKLLASMGADVNARKAGFGTPLSSGIIGNDYLGVRLLLDLGADTKNVNSSGCDALEWADSWTRVLE